MEFVRYFVNTVFDLLSLAIIARILMSWFQVNSHSPIARFIIEVTDPILRPIQRLMPRTGMIDFSPLIALIGMDILNSLIIRLLLYLPA